MKTTVYSARIGGFVSVNSGATKDCCSDAKVKYENNAACFVFENTGKLHILYRRAKRCNVI